MQKMLESIKARIKKANERDKKLERPIEKVARALWPWPESRLIMLVVLLAISDYITTFTSLRLSASHQVSEVGLLAKWALNSGGFAQLFLVDATAIGLLILLAFGVRALYNRFGFPGFGRTAFIFIFVPYVVIIVLVIINNLFLTFL